MDAKDIMIPVEPHSTSLADEETSEYDGPSKSQLKRDMNALQAMGGELISLSAERLSKLNLPDKLRTALADAKRITQNGAKRRQLQYIGRLMRDVDVEPIRELLMENKGISVAAKAQQQKLERLRTRLMETEDVIGELAREHPGLDIQHLRQLRRNAIKEAAQSKPPRAYREIFRVLRDLEDPSANNDDDEPND